MKSPHMSSGCGAASPSPLPQSPRRDKPMLALQEELRVRLGSLGFDEVRFARLSPPPRAGGLRAWLDSGYHADMGWMERTAAKRMDPGLVLEGARSAIILGVDYHRQDAGGEPATASAKPAWAKYSLYQDYHDSIKPALDRAGAVIEELYGAAHADY